MRAARRAANDYKIKTSLDYKTCKLNFFVRVRALGPVCTQAFVGDLTKFSLKYFLFWTLMSILYIFQITEDIFE